jgi:hypothetical protein
MGAQNKKIIFIPKLDGFGTRIRDSDDEDDVPEHFSARCRDIVRKCPGQRASLYVYPFAGCTKAKNMVLKIGYD